MPISQCFEPMFPEYVVLLITSILGVLKLISEENLQSRFFKKKIQGTGIEPTVFRRLFEPTEILRIWELLIYG
jgi:hypothetical protein